MSGTTSEALRAALEEISRVSYGVEITDTDAEKIDYWSSLALRMRAIARAALSAAIPLPAPDAWGVFYAPTNECIKGYTTEDEALNGARWANQATNDYEARPLYAALVHQAGEDGSAPARARKKGGNYQADGTIVAEFKTLAGKPRVVFEFDAPKGLLHIFDVAQVEPIDTPAEAARERQRLDLYSELADALGCDSMDSHAGRLARAERAAAALKL